MKGFLRSRLILTLTAFLIVTSAMAIPLSVLIGHSVAASPQLTSQAHHRGQGQHISTTMSVRYTPSLHQSTSTVPQVESSGNTNISFIPSRPNPVISGTPIPVPHAGAIDISLPTSTTEMNTVSYQSFQGMNERNQAISKPNAYCCEPADDSASIGPNNVVQTVNSEFTFYSRTGIKQYRTTFSSWDKYSGNLTDPKVVYDTTGQRFIMLIDTGSSILVSVAQQTDANGHWCTYTFPTSSSWFADQPKLGVDSNGIYVTVDLTQLPGGPSPSNELFSANRIEMESCQSATANVWMGLNTPEGKLAVSIVPAVIHSPAPYEYLIAAYPYGANSLSLWQLSGTTLVSYRVDTLTYSIGTAGSTLLPSAKQKGTTTKLELDDCRLYQASYMNGLLDVALTSAYTWSTGGMVTIIDWFKIDPNASLPAVVQQGGFGAPGLWDYYPAMQQDSNGNAVFVFGVSNGSTYPNVDYLGLTASGGLETTNALTSGSHFFKDANNGNPSRWGDYQSAALDPNNSTHIWITGMYADSSILFLGSYWRTSIGEVGA